MTAPVRCELAPRMSCQIWRFDLGPAGAFRGRRRRTVSQARASWAAAVWLESWVSAVDNHLLCGRIPRRSPTRGVTLPDCTISAAAVASSPQPSFSLAAPHFSSPVSSSFYLIRKQDCVILAATRVVCNCVSLICQLAVFDSCNYSRTETLLVDLCLFILSPDVAQIVFAAFVDRTKRCGSKLPAKERIFLPSVHRRST